MSANPRRKRGDARMRGFIYVGKGRNGRYKLAGIRPTIKEAIKAANQYEKLTMLVDYVRVHVMDENNIRYQSALLKRK